jgi:DNA-binding NarL/FixJ family response regulator
MSDLELEVLRYVAYGYSKKDIADIIHVSEKTIEARCQRAMNKLDIHDRVHLVRYAIREGFVKAYPVRHWLVNPHTPHPLQME